MSRFLAVNFHYIRDASYPYPGIHPLSWSAFTAQVDRFRADFDVSSVEELEGFLDGTMDLRGPSIVLTFDDGLKEQMGAARILEERGLRGFFFVSSAPLSEGRALTVHKGHWLRAHTPPQIFEARLVSEARSLGVDERGFEVRDADAAAAYRFDDIEIARTKFLLNFKLAEEIREKVIERIFDEVYPGEEEDFCAELYMNDEELAGLASAGHVVGAHSHSHRPLSTMDEAALVVDLETNSSELLTRVGHEPTWISYPFGGRSAVDETVITVAKKVGFRFGFTMEPGDNGPDGDPLALRRISTNEAPGGSSPRFWVKANSPHDKMDP